MLYLLPTKNSVVPKVKYMFFEIDTRCKNSDMLVFKKYALLSILLTLFKKTNLKRIENAIQKSVSQN